MKQFTVKMKCVVYKSVTVECETIEEAESDPWGHSVDEQETGMVDWEILRVEESK